MMMMLSDAEQRPLARSPLDRRQSIAEIATEATYCSVPELMPCWSRIAGSVHDGC